jgi:hypothetical protein
MNATAIAFDRDNQMYVSSRHDEAVYKVAPNGTMSTYAEGMGVATGIAFDREENLYVGDRSGTIFKIARDRQIFVFATLEPSVSAYHLAFGPARRPVRHRTEHRLTTASTKSILTELSQSLYGVWDARKAWPSMSRATFTSPLRSPESVAS